MKKLLLTLTLTLFSCVAFSQSEITMTKQEFIDNQIKMFGQLEARQSEISAQTDELMKSKMSPEEYERFKKENDLAEDKQLAEAAGCLGISTEKLESITKELDSTALLQAVEACSSKLPESITISGVNWAQVPGLADYNKCNEEFIAKKSGVPLEQYKKCAAQQEAAN